MSTTEGHRAQDEAIARAEHLEAVGRFRRSALIGSTLLWPSFALMDVLAVKEFGQGASLLAVLGPRGVSALINLALTFWAHRARALTPAQLILIDQLAYGQSSISIGLMAVSLGGLDSHYLVGVVLVLSARMFSLPPRHAARTSILPTLAGPLTLLVGAWTRTDLRPQFHDPRVLSVFALNVLYIMTAAVVMVAGNRMIAALRRQIFADRSIGRYRLRKRLGAGGMGEVWAAWHSGLRRDVALKILKPGSEGADAERFEREVRATSELTHPNTVRVFDYGASDDGLIYYAMELLVGEDLGAKVRREGRLPAAQAVYLIHQAARALAEAHARGIVHRDVKPENLFITIAGGEGDFVKVLDFGIARFASGDVDQRLTRADSVIGTPRYMAPEVVAGAPAGPPADVYALGCVLYFSIAGSPPFDAPTTAALYAAILRGTEAPIPAVPGLSQELAALLTRALARDPAQRFSDAGAFSEMLGRVPEAGQWRPTPAPVPRAEALGAPPAEVDTGRPRAPDPLDATAETRAKS